MLQVIIISNINIVSPGAQYEGHGNSFHGKGGRGNKVSQLRYSLRLLVSMCSTNDEAVLLDLHEQGIIPVVIGKIVIGDHYLSLPLPSPSLSLSPTFYRFTEAPVLIS